MKTCSSVLLLLCLAWFLSCSTLAYSNQKPIAVYIDNQPVVFDVAPVIEDGRTLVPMRAIFEALNVNVDWDGSTQTVIARTEYLLCLELQIGNKVATTYFRTPSENFNYETNEGTYQIDQVQKITLDVPPKLVENRTMVPLRFIAESLGKEVEWDNNNRNIYIGDCQNIKESFASKDADPTYFITQGGNFIDAQSGQSTTIWSVNTINQDVMGNPGCYVLLDLDGDTKKELIVQYDLAGDQIILHSKNGVWYGYYRSFRSMNDLKTDGTFSFSSSAFDSGVGRLAFTQNGMQIRSLVECDDNISYYQVNGQVVDQDTCNQAFEAFYQKVDVDWIPIQNY